MPLLLYLATAFALLLLAHAYVTRLTRAIALVILLLPLVFTGRALLTGRVYAPVELAYTTEPLNGYAGEVGAPEPQNRMLSDITFQMIPWREALRRSFANGEWPLSNRFEGCGDILAAETQPAPFSPFTLLALLLPAAASFGFTASIALFLAALGTFLLARELRCSEMAALIAVVAFTFSAPIALQILWPLGFAWALFPFVLMATRRIVDHQSIHSAAILTIALTLVALAGHPETLLHVTALGAIYGLYEILRPGRERKGHANQPLTRLRHPLPASRGEGHSNREQFLESRVLLPTGEKVPKADEGVLKLRPLGRVLTYAIASGIVALLLSAIVLLPFLDASNQTVEHRIRTEFFANGPLRVAAGLPTAAFLSDLLPFARASFKRFLMARAEAGSIVLALALFALWRSRARERWFFAIAGFLCLLASANAWPVAQLLHRLPLFDLALNDRLASAVPLCAGILAAFAIDAISDRAGAVMAGLVILLAAGAYGMRPTSIDIPRFAAEMAPLTIAVVIALFVRNRDIVVPSLLALILLQRTISDGALIPANNPKVAYPPIALFKPLQSIREPFRIAGIGPLLFPNTATMYGLEDARVMTAMTLTSFDDTFPLWCRHGGFGFNQIDDLTRPMLSMLNIRYAIVPKDEAIPAGWRDVTTDHNARLIENQHVLPRAFVPRNVRIGVSNDIEDMNAATDFSDMAWLDLPGNARDVPNGPGTVVIHPDHLDATMEHDGFIVISNAAWSGWRAYLDNRRTKIVRANHAFLGVFVPAGRHTVRMVYLPRSFVIGRGITFAMLAIIIVGFAARSILRRRNPIAGA